MAISSKLTEAQVTADNEHFMKLANALQKEKHRDMTEPEKRALRMFVLANGRTWKSKLRLWWMNPGTVTEEDMRLLYCLRNTHGTTWLNNLRFP